MNKINDGGAAFPVHTVYEDCGIDGNAVSHLTETISQGMTLRDYFAAKAMCGLIAQSNGSALASDLLIGSEYAYRMADAMLVAREVQS